MTAGLNGTPLPHPNSLLSGTGCDSAECDREQESVRLEKQVAGISVQTSQGNSSMFGAQGDCCLLLDG